jgi:cytochrome c-type biogenesis protein CcmH
MAVVVAACLAPAALYARRVGTVRGRQDAALALHRAQLAELDRDLAGGRILHEEHIAARLEVQRRLLADADLADGAPRTGGGGIVAAAVGLACLLSLSLYLIVGHPGFPPPMPPAAPPDTDQQGALIAKLRGELVKMDPHDPHTLEGYRLLGNAEAQRGNVAAAAEAWQHVLDEHYDPTLAAETAEAMTEAAGKVTFTALAMFKRALSEAPSDAPWRPMAEKRVAEAGG